MRPVRLIGLWFSLLIGLEGGVDPAALAAARTVVGSPDEAIVVEINASGALSYSIRLDGKLLFEQSRLGLWLRPAINLGQDVEMVRAVRLPRDATWENQFGKTRHVRDRHNELRLELREKGSGERFDMVFRVFDDGVAFRYMLSAREKSSVAVVEHEKTQFAFAGDWWCYAGEHDDHGIIGSQQWEFRRRRLSEIAQDAVIGLPLLVQTPAAWVAITESDLQDWSGMWLTHSPAAAMGNRVLGVKLAPRLDGQGLVKVGLPHVSPWRVIMIGHRPGDLIESNIVQNLATRCQLEDTSWIKPGLMAWDNWWSGGVQMTTARIKDYIQFAADMGWPYQLIDWRWYLPINKPESDVTKPVPEVDLPELLRFAREKHVRLWLWVEGADLARDDAYKRAFPIYEQWGIAGIKVDHMDRDDQDMVNWYETITRAAAEHHLMVNFHGAYKPTGLERTFPNQITREGILGNEASRSGRQITPEHKLILPFTRFLAGPGDFTPGGFLNRTPAQFEFGKRPTQVQGTRASELALFVVYDSPVCCACDSPEHYRGQPGADFLKVVPTVWDETKVLDAAVGEHLVIARRSRENWFLGALTDSRARDLPIKLDFLGQGRWKMRLWRDAADSDVNAEQVAIVEREVTAGDTLDLHLAPAGGAVARFEPVVAGRTP